MALWVGLSTIGGGTPILEQPPTYAPLKNWFFGFVLIHLMVLIGSAFQFFAFYMIFGFAARVPAKWLLPFIALLDVLALGVGVGYVVGSAWRGLPALFSGVFMLTYALGGWLGIRIVYRIFRPRIAKP